MALDTCYSVLLNLHTRHRERERRKKKPLTAWRSTCLLPLRKRAHCARSVPSPLALLYFNTRLDTSLGSELVNCRLLGPLRLLGKYMEKPAENPEKKTKIKIRTRHVPPLRENLPRQNPIIEEKRLDEKKRLRVSDNVRL